MFNWLKDKAIENPWAAVSAVTGSIVMLGVVRSQLLDPLILPLTRPLLNWFLGMKDGLASTGMSDSAALWISAFVVLYPIYEFLKYRRKVKQFINHNKQFFENGDESEN